MKYLILSITLLMSASVAAEDVNNITCKEIENLARHAMLARQSGMPMHKLIEASKDSDYMISVVVDAYEEKRYSFGGTIGTVGQQTVDEFAHKYYLPCYKSRHLAGGE